MKTMRVIYTVIMLAWVFAGLPGLGHSGDVAVLMSRDVEASRKTFDGFKDTLRHRIVGKYDMRGRTELGEKFLNEIQARVKPNLMFTVGASALKAAADRMPPSPVVYAMVLNPRKLIPPGANNITGVGMNVSVEDTLQLFRELSPKIRRVGVVFDPGNSSYPIMQASMIAKRHGIRLVTRAIRDSSRAVQALNSMRDEIDALWLFPDETILVPEVVEYTLLFSHRNAIPVVGLSDAHTKMGALASLSIRSSEDIGKQAGELANRVLRGIRRRIDPFVMPRQTKLTVNFKTAEKFGMAIPQKILQRADNAVKAPLYENGEWWVFRVKASDEPPSEFRVTYRNGRFESDEPRFLTLSYDDTFVTWVPKVTVHLNDGKQNWFDFPLYPGKEWSFDYPHVEFHSARPDRLGVDSIMTAPFLRVLETSAGTFEVLEIHRTDYGSDRGIATSRYPGNFRYDHVYFYSPETKSVVKHVVDRVNSASIKTHHYEMELIKYGRSTAAVAKSEGGGAKNREQK